MLRHTLTSIFFTPTLLFFFFFNDTATTEIYTLSLHDALPISAVREVVMRTLGGMDNIRLIDPLDYVDFVWFMQDRKSTRLNSSHTVISYAVFCLRSEEHTSELQSHSDLVCRLLLVKKKSVLE